MEEKRSILLQSPGSAGESSQSISPNAGSIATAAPTRSSSQEAGRLFAEEIERLAGVLRVERWDEVGPCSPTFHVYVRPDDRDTEYAVYELHGQIYDRYPDAYLEVVVLEAIEASIRNSAPSA
jgi:hypothetical protein